MLNQDPSDTTLLEPSWWNSFEYEKPKPYTKSWKFDQVVEEYEEENEVEDLPETWQTTEDPYLKTNWAFIQFFVEETEETTEFPNEWWETLEVGVKPYKVNSWAYYQETSFVLEFSAISETLFSVFDEKYYPRLDGLGLVLDSGFFGQIGTNVYDEAYYFENQRGLLVKRKLARIFVYDKLADAPGILALPEEDSPPGTLLGSVSYELFETTVTITDWEHLNWEDDTPVLRAVQVLLNEVPDCVTEVRVLKSPEPFWTSLGFKPDFKGDNFLHYFF